MKFVDIRIPCEVVHQHGETETKEPGVLSFRMTAGNQETTQDVLTRFADKVDAKMNLVDLGDET